MKISLFFQKIKEIDADLSSLIDEELANDPHVIEDTPIYLMERISDYILKRYNLGDESLLKKFDKIFEEFSGVPQVFETVASSLGETLFFEMGSWSEGKINSFRSMYSEPLTKAINVKLILTNQQKA